MRNSPPPLDAVSNPDLYLHALARKIDQLDADKKPPKERQQAKHENLPTHVPRRKDADPHVPPPPPPAP